MGAGNTEKDLLQCSLVGRVLSKMHTAKPEILPQHFINWAWACNLSSWKAEAGGHPWQYSEFQTKNKQTKRNILVMTYPSLPIWLDLKWWWEHISVFLEWCFHKGLAREVGSTLNESCAISWVGILSELTEKEKMSWDPAFIFSCFLTEEKLWPAILCFYGHSNKTSN